MAKKKSEIEMVKAVYVSRNKARHAVYGGSRSSMGRPLNYGYRKDGDVFNVAVSDIVATPDSFVAHPCKKPFVIKDGKVEDPCVQKVAPPKHPILTDIPGIGMKTQETLNEFGIYTHDDVLENADEAILKRLTPQSRKSIKAWQEEQKSSSSS